MKRSMRTRSGCSSRARLTASSPSAAVSTSYSAASTSASAVAGVLLVVDHQHPRAGPGRRGGGARRLRLRGGVQGLLEVVCELPQPRALRLEGRAVALVDLLRDGAQLLGCGGDEPVPAVRSRPGGAGSTRRSRRSRAGAPLGAGARARRAERPVAPSSVARSGASGSVPAPSPELRHRLALVVLRSRRTSLGRRGRMRGSVPSHGAPGRRPRFGRMPAAYAGTSSTDPSV